MLRTLWFPGLLGLSRSRKDRRRRAAQVRRYVRPQLEQLEERLTPAAQPLPFSTAANAAQLQADINTANSNPTQSYTIALAPNTAFQLTAVLTITNAAGVTIAGNGDTITAATLDRSFLVETGANVTLQDLTITGGDVVGTVDGVFGGGAIFDTGGNVTLSKVNVQGNTVSYFGEGGGIYVSSGNLTIEGGSTIQSNSALGITATPGFPFDGSALGGGIYVSGASTVQISDSTIRNNSVYGGQGVSYSSTAGVNGGSGGAALGGGLFVNGVGWNVTLTGDTFSDNAAIAGKGGNGTSGGDATASNTSGGNGGIGGVGGTAKGGAVFVSGNGNLTILNDLNAPTSNPSTMIDNFVQGGSGGNGGAGGTSTGTAGNSSGGSGGGGGNAKGGALAVDSSGTTQIGNTAIYGNSVLAANGGGGGAAGTGGSGAAGGGGTSGRGGFAQGGGVTVSGDGNFTLVNSTLAKNAVTAGVADLGAGASASALGGGLIDNATRTSDITLDNNTITQNTVTGNGTNLGAGIFVNNFAVNPTLVNNVMQDNLGSSDLVVNNGNTLSNATNNFIESVSPSSAVSTTSNIIGNTQVQLGGAVGVTANGTPTGGPIYYPLLSGTVSIQGGATTALSTIAGVEGTTTVNAADEIGNNRSSNGAIDLGAVQSTIDNPTVLTVSASTPLTTSPNDQNVALSATVTSSNAAINQGTVTFTLVNGNNVPVSSAVQGSVLNGTANALLSVPGGLPAGTYFVRAAYTDNQGVYAGSIGDNSLTLNSPPPSSPSPSPSPPSQFQAALTVAIDTAALVLLNDATAYLYLESVSQLLLGQPLPPPAQLVPDILSELTYAGELGLIGLQAGINYANSIIGGA